MRETENSRRYHFADFTRRNYAALLRLALARYPIRTYLEVRPGERFLVWRHDVDFSMHAALKLAEIEAEEGVRATYFFLLHSEFYNLLERECIGIGRRILSLGHRLGLHFDHQFWGATSAEGLASALAFENDILQRCFGQRVEAFSFHIPDSTSAQFEDDSYGGLINAYSSFYRTKVAYCSDSNGYWRFRRLQDVLVSGADDSLQVLTHPEYWQESVMSPKERVERCIRGRAEKTRDWYRETLEKSGRADIDW
jgi:hypothetical protein